MKPDALKEFDKLLEDCIVGDDDENQLKDFVRQALRQEVSKVLESMPIEKKEEYYSCPNPICDGNYDCKHMGIWQGYNNAKQELIEWKEEQINKFPTQLSVKGD